MSIRYGKTLRPGTLVPLVRVATLAQRLEGPSVLAGRTREQLQPSPSLPLADAPNFGPGRQPLGVGFRFAVLPVVDGQARHSDETGIVLCGQAETLPVSFDPFG